MIDMASKKKFIIAGFLAIIGFVFFLSYRSTADPAFKLTKTYRSEIYGFTVKFPEDFSAREVSGYNDGDGGTIIFESNKNPGDGFQIVISRFDENLRSLNKERILKDIPEIGIHGEKPVRVKSGYQGLTFESDSPEFDGRSRELWFVYRGYLFQLSTYERLTALLSAIFDTWRFQ